MDSSHGQLPIHLCEPKNDRCFQLTGDTKYDVQLTPSISSDRWVWRNLRKK